jgi:hypothetical protein
MLTLISVVIFPIMFPSLFWSKESSNDGKLDSEDAKSDKPVVMYFNVGKKAENPYTNGPTSLAIYDEEDEHAYNIHDVNDNEAFGELCTMLKSRIGANNVVYLVTYDNDFKVPAMKSILGDFFNEIDVDARFIDLKHLFYCTHHHVQKIVYSELAEFYRVPSLENRPIEYAALFAQLIRDYDPTIDEHMSDGLDALFNHMSM